MTISWDFIHGLFMVLLCSSENMATQFLYHPQLNTFTLMYHYLPVCPAHTVYIHPMHMNFLCPHPGSDLETQFKYMYMYCKTAFLHLYFNLADFVHLTVGVIQSRANVYLNWAHQNVNIMHFRLYLNMQ